MIPDPISGRVLRALAIALVAACAVTHGACGRAEERTGERRVLAGGGAIAGGTPAHAPAPRHLRNACGMQFERLRGFAELR